MSGSAYIDGRLLGFALVLICLVFLMSSVPGELKRPMVFMIPITAAGEFVLSRIMGLYRYHDDCIPYWVPFGHAVIFGMGIMLSRHPWVVAHSRCIEFSMTASYAAAMGAAVLAIGDSFSVIGGVVFGAALIREKTRLFYLMVGLVALYAEFLGTRFGCWRWHPEPLPLLGLRAANPPIGAISFYVFADLMAIRAERLGWDWCSPRRRIIDDVQGEVGDEGGKARPAM